MASIPPIRQQISIHAPHARSDLKLSFTIYGYHHFNPRSSCEERLQLFKMLIHLFKFQSTLLMRGATRWIRLQAHLL